MSSLEQRLSRIEEKLKQENKEARRRIDLNIDMSPQRSRPRPSKCPLQRNEASLRGKSRIAEERTCREGGKGRGRRGSVIETSLASQLHINKPEFGFFIGSLVLHSIADVTERPRSAAWGALCCDSPVTVRCSA